jgi:hypothetical protein
MIKSTLALLLCLACLSASAQTKPPKLSAVMASADTIHFPVDPTSQLITYSGVVPVAGASQAELYARGKLWFANTFRSPKDVVQADEKEAGVIQGTGWQTIMLGSGLLMAPGKLWYTVNLAIKEGRYKYTITSFAIAQAPSKYIPDPQPYAIEPALLVAKPKDALRNSHRLQRLQIKQAGEKLTAEIKAGMAKPAAGTVGGKTDW